MKNPVEFEQNGMFVAFVPLLEGSWSYSFELSRRSATRSLLGDEESSSLDGSRLLFFRARKVARRRHFLGEGSASDSEPDSDAIEAVSERHVLDEGSQSIAVGKDRFDVKLSLNVSDSLLRFVMDCTSMSDFLIRKLAIDLEPALRSWNLKKESPNNVILNGCRRSTIRSNTFITTARILS